MPHVLVCVLLTVLAAASGVAVFAGLIAGIGWASTRTPEWLNRLFQVAMAVITAAAGVVFLCLIYLAICQAVHN